MFVPTLPGIVKAQIISLAVSTSVLPVPFAVRYYALFLCDMAIERGSNLIHVSTEGKKKTPVPPG